MRKDLFIKTVTLIVGVLVIIGVWFGLSTTEGQDNEIQELEATVKKQEEQIEYLQNSKREQTELSEDAASQKMKETVNVFIESTFHVEEDHYEERKEEAEVVLTQDLFEKQFSSEKETLQYEFDVSDVTVYLAEENQSAYVVFKQEVKNLANQDSSYKKMTLQVSLQKEGERWLVNDFDQIKAEPL
ncbi:hypothetical protein [Halobacillus sp. A5]|uniref:hypothetical protein n=1 Tax=Halobacillus sp. A5 TaxID=2880263 RepID=UPI0020A62249|nr:hypothetical protein [Halobacillus sp. A5]MCP3029656.1 hypothetical protein [Halobacillus sp. A5]